MKYKDLPNVQFNKKLVRKDKCIIEKEEYPLFIGRMIIMMQKETQPVLAFPADPGKGKTFAMARIGEILHDELDILEGEFKPEEQILSDPLKFIRSVRKNRKRFFMVPDADSIFPSDEWRSPKNKANRDIIYLSRIFGNPLGYDMHELSKVDKAIRTNHNIRITAGSSKNSYCFKVERIVRQNDSLSTNMQKKDLGSWQAKKPKPETVERIEKLDEEEKENLLIEREDQIIEERRKQKFEEGLDFST